MTYPLYEVYARAHGRDWYGAALGPGVFQHVGRAHRGLALRRILDAERLPADAPADARYLVVHKQPWRELVAASRRLQVASGSAHAFSPAALGVVFQHRAVGLPPGHPLAAARIYEDAVVAVYDLSRGPAARLDAPAGRAGPSR